MLRQALVDDSIIEEEIACWIHSEFFEDNDTHERLLIRQN